MSQHIYPAIYQNRPVTVMIGYDRPLRGFFMVIETNDEMNEYVYSSLDDPALLNYIGLPATPNRFVTKLLDLGIPVHANVIEEIKADQRWKVGNRFVRYDAAGQVEI